MNTGVVRSISVCADDFGANEAACLAILNLGSRGAISATSCLVEAPCFDRHVRALQSNTQVSIGLHLDLTEFAPDPVRTSLARWLCRGCLLRSVDRAAVLREIRRQLQRFEDAFGRAPAFADGHCHVHQIPGVREPLLEELHRRYGRSVAVRSTRSLRHYNFKGHWIGKLGGSALHSLIAAHHLYSNSDFAGVYDLTTAAGFPLLMRQWLRGIADNGLIMCHPELPACMPAPTTARESEYCFLYSAQWRSLLGKNSVRLQPFVAL